jgi:hypothetical protein
VSPRPKTPGNLGRHRRRSAEYNKRKQKPERKGEKEVEELRAENKARVKKRNADKRRFADIERRVQERAEGRIE